MKIIDINKPITADGLYHILTNELNPIFKERRQTDMAFDILQNGNQIDIINNQFYEGYLFRLEIKGNTLVFHESEHYVDDINALTINGILDELFVKHLGATAPQL